MTGGALNADFALMTAVAARVDDRNEETRAMLQSFIGQMTSVPPSVWGGAAAVRFREVVDRWNTESVALHQSLRSDRRDHPPQRADAARGGRHAFPPHRGGGRPLGKGSSSEWSDIDGSGSVL